MSTLDDLRRTTHTLGNADITNVGIHGITSGYDGHSLRAFGYFREQMPSIPDSVSGINSISKLFSQLRNDSKAPTFALTYAGTWRTLVSKCGFSEEAAKSIEEKFHILYAESRVWVRSKLTQAAKDGYVTLAFGLRLRTPILKQTVLGTKVTPFAAEAESRTAGNALGQSWGLLNNRASAEFMQLVRASKYANDIKLSSHIHDAQYFIVKNDIEVIEFINQNLVKAVQWQDHPDIYHPDVKLGGELSIFYPNWCTEIEIPNYATKAEIEAIAASS